MRKHIRCTVTFEFEDEKISDARIKDRFDDAMKSEFGGGDIDVHARWVTRLEDAPLFGATTPT